MTAGDSVFEKTYESYLAKVGERHLESLAPRLGAEAGKNGMLIPLFGQRYEVSESRIEDPSGKRPSLDICVILCRYIIMCPEFPPKGNEWVSFRDLKDSGPLTVYFANDVEKSISNFFSGNTDALREASERLHGFEPDMEAAYDLAFQFPALPRVPLLLLFNDGDREFPAKCSVLLERRSEKYLDAECIAMLGRHLFSLLKEIGQA
jgi:uncharacterized protein DUF3786